MNLRTLGKVLSIKEAAVRIGVTTRTVERWIEKKILRSFKIGGVRRIRESELERLAD